jgi:signal transduction histidine kinase
VQRLLLAMIGSIVVIGALAWWDEQRNSEAGLAELGDDQYAAASAAAASVAPDLAGTAFPERAARHLHALQRDGVRVFLVAPGAQSALALDGSSVALPHLAPGARVLRLGRDEAPVVGLPPRTAMVGVADAPSGWRVVVAASAERQRDRDSAGLARLLLSMGVATGLVAIFGGIALARQRTQLELAQRLAVAEAARARDAELERLSKAATMAAVASGVAHELSTPLGVIVGRAEQIRDRAADERTQKAAHAILEQAANVDEVVRGFLGLARGAPIALQEVAPAKLVAEAAELVAHRFARAGVTLATPIAADLPAIRCEPLLFKHALVNLLLNAVDASPAGSTVTLDVSRAGAEVAFVVTDDGEGITPAAAARAKEPFFTTKGHGTGLGLAIAHEIASTHRGTLSIGPRPTRGTEASISIPAGPHA